MKRLAIFASGNGSNFSAIAKYHNEAYKVELLICDNESAYVLERAKKLNIPFFVFNIKHYKDKENYELAILKHLDSI